MKPNGKGDRLLITGGLLLIAAALCFAGYNLWDDCRAAASASQIVSQLDARAPDAPQGEASPPEPEPVPAYLLDPAMEMPTVEVDGHDYIGTVDIPALSLSLPVMSQWSDEGAKLSPCRFSGSAYLDSLIIAGHNYRGHFGGLRRLSAGDEVTFTDAAGNRFRYQVSQLATVGGDDLDGLNGGQWDLTLFTCTLAGTSRVVVRCQRAAE